MSKTLKWILIGAGGIVLLLLILNWINGKDKDVVKVTADVVKRCTIVETVNATGKVFPELEVKVGSGISGEVTELFVKEGDSVTKGQVIAKITSDGTRSAPRINPNDLGSFMQNMQSAPSASQTKTSIKAPISGIVSMLSVRVGERVGGMQMSSTDFIRIADMSRMEVRVDVNENDIIKVKQGDSADLEIEAYSKRKFKGVVSSIANTTSKRDASSFLSNDVTSYEVRILLDRASYADLVDTSARRAFPFRPGMNARADIKTRTKPDVLCVAAGAVASRVRGSDENVDDKKKSSEDERNEDALLVSDDLEEVVFVINDQGIVSRRVVTTGVQDMNHFEILDGLKEGEKIVTAPYSAVSRTLKNGSRVRVVPKGEIFDK